MLRVNQIPINALMLIITLALLWGCNKKSSPPNQDGDAILHTQWDTLLKKNVTADGWVDYKGFKTDSTDFQEYLNLLSKNHPNENWTDDERKTYWINAYNAFTVELIVAHYPLESIKDITKLNLPFVSSPWDVKFIEIESETYDLNSIEHGILRKEFNDPRIHYAINCASISCPYLLNAAFTADSLDAQLDKQAAVFINDNSKNEIEADKIALSKIYKWFGGDFKVDQTLIEHLNKYSEVEISAEAEVSYLDYSWALNEKESLE